MYLTDDVNIICKKFFYKLSLIQIMFLFKFTGSYRLHFLYELRRLLRR